MLDNSSRWHTLPRVQRGRLSTPNEVGIHDGDNHPRALLDIPTTHLIGDACSRIVTLNCKRSDLNQGDDTP